MANVLANFLLDLFETGAVSVAGELHAFQAEDVYQAAMILDRQYERDLLRMPYQAPEFSEDAALWAAKYLYIAAQLMMLRELDAESVIRELPGFPEHMSPRAIYSVDLTFRYLPDLFALARGLAPDDILVLTLEKTAIQWPFSSVGMRLPKEVDPGIVLDHPSLRYAYIDRIIASKDRSRLTPPPIRELIREVLGGHLASLWPSLQEI
ncbi:MAG: hypothetical protein AAF587_39155 [Bacteroidota bacterium]